MMERILPRVPFMKFLKVMVELGSWKCLATATYLLLFPLFPLGKVY